MTEDPLAPLLQHFNARAQLFFTGHLCGTAAFPDDAGTGHLHLLRAGRTRLHDAAGHTAVLEEPTLLFYARPLSHWFEGDPERGADLACASVAFEHAACNPLALALPARFSCPLSELPASAALHELLFAEAFAERPARQEVLNRLFEVVLIELLRTTLIRGQLEPGLLRGLGHPQVGRALAAVHAAPEADWTLPALAGAAGQSRAAFAAAFHEVVGLTPADYVQRWRVHVAQALLLRGTPLKAVAGEVGYDSQAGFLRAFKAVVGISPTAWRKERPRRP